MYTRLPITDPYPTPGRPLANPFSNPPPWHFFQCFFQTLKNRHTTPRKLPKSCPNPLQNPPKTVPKQRSSCKPRKSKKMQPFHTKTSFLTFTGLRKSSQNRCKNAFKISFMLDTLLEPPKIRFSMLKSSQDGPQKFPKFSKIGQNRLPKPTVQHSDVGFAQHCRQNAIRRQKTPKKSPKPCPKPSPNPPNVRPKPNATLTHEAPFLMKY